MRDYALTQAEGRDHASVFSGFIQLFINWRRRKTLRTLVALEDHMLRDIGVSRDEVYRLMKLPLSVDPLWELERQSRVRASRGIMRDL
jgi:uncharacterized protein YjiS (DUF1127 family)